MRLRMLTSAIGPNMRRVRGEVYEIPQEEAEVYLEDGYAEAVEAEAKPTDSDTKAEEKPVEVAAEAEEVETAAMFKGRRTRKK